jgi:hypothetical protein
LGALQGRHFSAQGKHEPAVTFTLKTGKVEGEGGGVLNKYEKMK